MQKIISEHTTRRTLKQMCYSSRRPHRVPLLSAKNRTRRLQFTLAWSDESWFLLRHSDVSVRIWRKENESIDPSCLVSTVQAAGGGVMVWGIFYWHTLHLSTNWASFKQLQSTWVLLLTMSCLYDYSVPSSDGYFQQDNSTCHKAQIISD